VRPSLEDGGVDTTRRHLAPRPAEFARKSATEKIADKNKKFAGLRGFASIAKKKRDEAAERKRKEVEEEAEMAKKMAEEAARPRRSILSMLDVALPTVEKQNIEEFAEESFELKRKGIWGGKTTVAKVLSWKNVRSPGGAARVWGLVRSSLSTLRPPTLTPAGDHQEGAAEVAHVGAGDHRRAVLPQRHGLHGRPQHQQGGRGPRGEAAQDLSARARRAARRGLLPDRQAVHQQPQPVRAAAARACRPRRDLRRSPRAAASRR